MAAPWTFGGQTGPIPLSELDDNFAYYSQLIHLTIDGVNGSITSPNYAAQLQVQLNNFSWYANISSALPGDLYGSAANVIRTSSGGATVGGFFSGQGATGVSSEVWGLVTQAITQPGSVSTLVSAEHGTSNQTNNNTNPKVGTYVVFKDRPDGQAGTTQSLGSNQFNYGARGIWIESQSRSTTGEFCGWKRAMYFGPDSIDADTTGPGMGLDFADLRYLSTNDPTTAYHCTAIIRMAPYQSFLWNAQPSTNTDPANPVRSWFAANATPNARLVLASNTGPERLSVDVVTGERYLNGALTGAFRVHKNGVNQTGIPSGVFTKVTFSTATFDNNTDYNTGTQKFIPGLNQTFSITASVQCVGSGSACRLVAAIYKNGSIYAEASNTDSGTSKPFGAVITTAIRGNGSDFYEVYVFQDNGATIDLGGGPQDTCLSAVYSG